VVSEETESGLGAMSRRLHEPLGRSSWEEKKAIETVGTRGHEVTHVIMTAHRLDPELQKTKASEVKYYRGSALSAGGTVRDPERVFKEAGAQYVDRRVYLYVETCLALEDVLARVRGGTLGRDAARVEVDKIAASYELRSCEPVFGKDGSLDADEMDSTVLPMRPAYKAYLDRVVLDNSIGDTFDKTPGFRAYHVLIFGSPRSKPDQARPAVETEAVGK